MSNYPIQLKICYTNTIVYHPLFEFSVHDAAFQRNHNFLFPLFYPLHVFLLYHIYYPLPTRFEFYCFFPI